MPKRSNAFQRFIYDLETLVAPAGAEIEESALVKDRSTGALVEVDVLVRHKVGPREIKIGIECRDHNRPADAGWIDQLHSRQQNLELDKLIAVSRNGFSRNAKKKAKQFGIEVVGLKDKTNVAKWISLFGFLEVVGIQTMLPPKIPYIKATFFDEERFVIMSAEDMRQSELVLGSKKFPLDGFCYAFLKRLEVKKWMDSRPQGDHVLLVHAEPKPGTLLNFQKRSRMIVGLEVPIEISQHIEEVPVEHFDYQEAQVAKVEKEIDGGPKISMLLAQTKDGVPKISFEIKD